MLKNLSVLRNYVLLLVITVANFWFWQILVNNFLLGSILLIIELCLFSTLIPKREGSNKVKFGIISVFLLITSLFLLKSNFDKTLTSINPTELRIQDKRHAYLSDSLGKMFTNRYVLHYYKDYDPMVGKYIRNVFYALDPNLYFFRSHPREKSGIDEYAKYPPIVLPFFIIGILFLTISFKKYKPLVAFLIAAILLTGFINPGYKLGPVLMFPFVNIVLYLGLTIVIPKLKLVFKK